MALHAARGSQNLCPTMRNALRITTPDAERVIESAVGTVRPLMTSNSDGASKEDQNKTKRRCREGFSWRFACDT